jgi:hypothetical protein
MLGGLCQHVEGGLCGVRMLNQVCNVMDSLTRGLQPCKLCREGAVMNQLNEYCNPFAELVLLPWYSLSR